MAGGPVRPGVGNGPGVGPGGPRPGGAAPDRPCIRGRRAVLGPAPAPHHVRHPGDRRPVGGGGPGAPAGVAVAESIPPDPGAADPPGARLADALVDVATGGPEPATVVVHAEAGVLTRQEPETGPWLAETDGGRRLPSEAVRRLACDGRIEWVLERVGRRGRTVSGSLLRVLRYRDGGACRFPGCERKRWLHAHHLVHWAEGGATNLDNLVLLCHAHHRLIHEGGWRTSGHPARELRFHDPGGRPLRTHPLRRTTAVGARGFPPAGRGRRPPPPPPDRGRGPPGGGRKA